MGVFALLSGLLVLALLIGAILGWVASFRLSRLETAVRRLESRLARQESQWTHAARERQPRPGTFEDTPARRGSPPRPRPSEPSRPIERPHRTLPHSAEEASQSFHVDLNQNIRNNWMVWLGGISVGLAGVFLVGYSIEMGLLGPRARIVAAVLAGLALHTAAEWLRRRTGAAHPAFAALAGGASITLYAAIFAALELYSLLTPGLAFALLALISLLTMALALVHGPALAIIGLLGAYVVPILVSTGGGNILVALTYSLIVSAAALLLTRFVYRPWLWYGVLAGALGWWLLSLSSANADGFRGLYLAAFAYLALAVPVFDWALSRVPRQGDPGTEPVQPGQLPGVDGTSLTILLTALAGALSIAWFGAVRLGSAPGGDAGFELGAALTEWSPLIVVVLLASRQRASLRFAPWALLVTQWFAWFFASIGSGEGEPAELARLALAPDQSPLAFLGFAVWMALFFSSGAWLAGRGKPYDPARSSLLWLAPVLWLALTYLLVTDLSTSWEWALATLALGLVYMLVSGLRLERVPEDKTCVWPMLGAHAAYALAAAMFLREATLTLALAAQIVSLAWLRRRFRLAALAWIMKAVLALIVVRLTLNPWLMTYPSDVHWSLWTYGGAVLCCFFAAMITRGDLRLRQWLEAASLHLLVLFLGAEVRYGLYDGNIFVRDFTLTEAAINAVLWGGLALSYFKRSQTSEHLAPFYVLCSRVLMTLALAAYAFELTVLNPLWSSEPVGATRIWNILLLAYGAPVLVALAAYLFYDPRFKRLAAWIAAGGLLVFVSMEIRHLWQGVLDLGRPSSAAESYTYSATWMILAVVTILASTRFGIKDGYRAGMGLLIVVIAKIFVIDMSNLEGLLRVASFMGLGLALLGLAYLYQRTARQVS